MEKCRGPHPREKKERIISKNSLSMVDNTVLVNAAHREVSFLNAHLWTGSSKLRGLQGTTRHGRTVCCN